MQRVRAAPAATTGTPGSQAWALVQAAHAGPTVAVTLAMGLLTLAADLTAGWAAVVVAAVLTGQLTIGWSNDLIDQRRDVAAGRSDKPLATGELSGRVVRAATAAALVATVMLSLYDGWPGLAQLLAVAAGWGYNLGVKSTPLSWLPYAVAFGALPLFVALAPGSAGLPWWLVVAGAVLGTGAHFVNVVPDLADDAATGVRGLPHRLGARRSVATAVGLLGAGSVLVALAPAGGVSAAGWVALAVVAALVVAAFAGSGRTPFRAAMLIALVDVVLVGWTL